MMPKNLLRYGPLATLALIALLLAGCGDDKAGSSTSPGTLERLFSYPEITGCATCHDSSNTYGPDLSTATKFRENLVEKYSTDFNWTSNDILELTATCGEQFHLVSPTRPHQSAVLMTLSEDWQDSSCNSAVGTHLSYSDKKHVIDDLALWIENGAKP